MEWHKTEEHIPKFEKDEWGKGGWVLGRYSTTKMMTMRYIESNKAWQDFKYNWCPTPKEWIEFDQIGVV